jgi:type II secretory pathway pseudopilin PulG
VRVFIYEEQENMGNVRARSFVVIMIVISLVALILRVAIVQFVNFNITQNEAAALETLKLLSTAIENYAKDHMGVFPTSLEALVQSSPAYIEKEYISLSYEKGYNFNCLRLESSGYTCSASPSRCKITGKKAFTITTGQVLSSEECGKKE